MTTDPDFADLAAELAACAPEVAPPASGLQDLLRTVSTVEGTPGPDPGRWERTILPGIWQSILHVDEKNRRLTAYYRLDPGGRIPAHTHTGDEDVFILSGDLHCADGSVMRAGDLKRSTAGTFHPELWSVEGCVSLMVSPLDDEGVRVEGR